MKQVIMTLGILIIFTCVSINAQAPPPTLLKPGNNATVNSCGIFYDWDLDDWYYWNQSHLQIWDDSGFMGERNYTRDHVNWEPSDYSTSCPVSWIPDNTTFSWRVKGEFAYFGNHWSGWSSTWHYKSNLPGLETELPASNATMSNQRPTLQWSDYMDGDFAEHSIFRGAWYLYISYSNDFSSNVLVDTMSWSAHDGWQLPTDNMLRPGKKYYWKVKSRLTPGTGGWTNTDSFTVNCDDPQPPFLSSPTNGATEVDPDVYFRCHPILDQTYYAIKLGTEPTMQWPFLWAAVQNGVYHRKLENNTTYYWHMRAEYDCALSPFGEIWSFTTKLLKPTLMSPDNGIVDISQPVYLEWDEVEGVDNYQLQVDDQDNFGSPAYDMELPGTGTFIGGLDDGTTYYWRVRAHDEYGWGAWSDVFTFTTECLWPSPPVLETPSHELTGVPQPVQFDWSEVADAVEYRFQLYPELQPDSVLAEIDTDASEYLLSDNPDGTPFLDEGTAYHWQVRARYDNGCGWGDWSPANRFVTFMSCPELLGPDSGTIGVHQPVYLNWDEVIMAEHYILQIAQTDSFLTPAVDSQVGGQDYTAPINSDGSQILEAETRYYWRVRACNCNCQSEWSTAWNFVTEKAADVSEIPTEALPDEFSLSQNYPNPFNPTTTILFALPRREAVKINVYNILGEKTDTPLEQVLPAGRWSITWDGTEYPSGVYYYQIRAGEFYETRKMVLLK